MEPLLGPTASKGFGNESADPTQAQGIPRFIGVTPFLLAEHQQEERRSSKRDEVRISFGIGDTCGADADHPWATSAARQVCNIPEKGCTRHAADRSAKKAIPKETSHQHAFCRLHASAPLESWMLYGN